MGIKFDNFITIIVSQHRARALKVLRQMLTENEYDLFQHVNLRMHAANNFDIYKFILTERKMYSYIVRVYCFNATN